MIEALAVVFLRKKAGKIAQVAGLNAKKMKLLVVAGWFGGEILGLIFGLLRPGGGIQIVRMLIGAVAGSGFAFSIVNGKANRALAQSLCPTSRAGLSSRSRSSWFSAGVERLRHCSSIIN
jgi:hypothetical protein